MIFPNVPSVTNNLVKKKKKTLVGINDHAYSLKYELCLLVDLPHSFC